MNAQLLQVTDFVFPLTPGDVLSEARRAATLMCLDALGVTAAATPMEAGRLARDKVALLYAAGAPSHAAPMLFKGRQVSVAESDAQNASFPNTRDADVRIMLHDGRVLDSGLVHARGESERPMPEADIITKIEEFAGPALGAARANAIRYAVLGFAAGLSFEIEAYNRTVTTADRREGVAAFNEKRKPDCSGS